MDARKIADILREIADYLDLGEGNKFKSAAYRNAARALEALDRPVDEVAESGELEKTPGIGKATGGVVREVLTGGRSAYLEELRAQYPPGILELSRVPKLGTRKIRQIYEALGISTVEDLEDAAREGRLAPLPGFGKKTEEMILAGIEQTKKNRNQVLLPLGIMIAAELSERINSITAVQHVEIAGSIRRRLEVAGEIRLVVTAKDAGTAAARIAKIASLSEVQYNTETLTAMVRDQLPLHVRFTDAKSFGAAMFFETGSDEFVERFVAWCAKKGYELSADRFEKNGKSIDTALEEDIFEELGIAPVPPELRESFVAPKKKAPKLVSVTDIRGTFHVHSEWSDGRHSLAQMFGSARDRGFEYLGISDHSKTASYAGGLTVERVEEQTQEIETLRPDYAPMRIFRGSEADILGDGAIDYDDPVLAEMDFVVASVHSRFRIEKDEMTERIVNALRNPYVTFLGHLTGRLLLAREGYTFDFDKVFDTAAEEGVMIEINGDPRRLELDWRWLRRAADRGVTFSINPDAHSMESLGYILNGAWVARKGGIPPELIFNTKPLDEVEDYLAARKKRALKNTRT